MKETLLNVYLKVKSFIIQKKTGVFAFFLLLSTLTWSMIKLSDNYETNIQIEVVFDSIPKDKKLLKKSTQELEILLNARGFQILKERISNHKFIINLNKTIPYKNRHILLSEEYLNPIRKQFPNDIFVKGIKPDTLYFDFEQLIQKDIPIEPLLDLHFTTGYNFDDSLRIEPQLVTAIGAKGIIDTLSKVITNSEKLDDIDQDFELTLSIIAPKDVLISRKKVNIYGKVSQIFEKIISVPINIINQPKHTKVKLYPNSINLLCKGTVKNIKKIIADDFMVVFDYNDIVLDQDEYYPKIIKSPSAVDVKIVKNVPLEVIVLQ